MYWDLYFYLFIYIHNKKILHNDLKSDNVVLDKEEREEIPYFPISLSSLMYLKHYFNFNLW